MQTDGAGQLSVATVSSDPTMGGDLSGPASNCTDSCRLQLVVLRLQRML